MIDITLRQGQSILDCVVLDRNTRSGSLSRVAYVVSHGPWQPQRARSTLAEHFGTAAESIAVVPIDSMPLNDDGSPDASALAALPIIDEESVANAQRLLSDALGRGRVAALGASQPVPWPPLHHADLLPGWTRRIAAAPTGSGAAAAPSPATEPTAPPAFSDGGPLRLPDDGRRTLGDLLRAASRPEVNASIVCIDSDGVELRFGYADLLQRAERVLGGLRSAGLQRGDPVVLHVRHCREYFEAFWGCVLGGIVPVPTPIAPSYADLNGNVRRVGDASDMLDGAPILCGSGQEAELRQALRLLEREGTRLLSVDALRAAEPIDGDRSIAAGDVAIMMLTSGSTGKPKGVPLTHRNLISRGAACCIADGLDGDSVSVNWMPLDHVGGIVLMHLRDVWLACAQVHVATELVTRDPLFWLDLLERFRATNTFAPNFAFGLVCGLANEVGRCQWDLSSVRMILNGGEAVVASIARRFLKLLALHGLRADSMVPAWGMSETSSGVTHWHDFRLDYVSDSDPYVPVGAPLPGVSLRIVDDRDQVLREGQIGQLQVQGETLFGGYYGNRPPHEEVFTEDGWFRTGDLARLDDGVLSITGRDKDDIIVNGSNFTGASIETEVDELGCVERSFTAAYPIAEPGSDRREGLALFFVPNDESDEGVAEAVRLVRKGVVRAFGFSPAYLVPLGRAHIPKTSLGKIQRKALQQSLIAGQFEAELRRVDVLTGNEYTLPRWFFRRHWRPRQAPLVVNASGARPVFLLGDGSALADVLHDRLKGEGRPVLRIDSAMHDSGHADAVTSLASLDTDADAALDVLCLWHAMPLGRAGTPGRRAAMAAARVAALVAALRRRPGPVTLAIVGNCVEAVLRGELADPERAAIVGLLQAAAHESAALSGLHLDAGDAPPAEAAAFIADELRRGGAATEVAWRSGRRWVPVLRAWKPVAPAAPSQVLRAGGRYVVSGGRGGIGRALVAMLRHEFDADVVVLGRHAKPGSADPKIIEVAADVIDPAAVRAALGPVLSAWGGELDAIFHLAAVLHERAVADEDFNGLYAQIGPKLDGAHALHEIAGAHGATLVLFSSIVGLMGGANFGAYAAASRSLDAMAGSAGPVSVITIDWSAWRETGLNLRHGASDALRAIGGIELTPEQALLSLRVLLDAQPACTVVGLAGHHPQVARLDDRAPTPPRLRVAVEVADHAPTPAAPPIADRFGTPVALEMLRLTQLPLDERGAPDRAAAARLCDPQSGFQAPSTRTELELAALWRRILGVESVSVGANFFEIGGRSLLATQLLNAIAQEFRVRCTLRDIFETATISGQADLIDARRLASAASDVSTEPVPSAAKPGAARVLSIGSGQQRLWFIDRMMPRNPAYHLTASITFTDLPATEALQASLQTLVDRHEALRTHFPLVDGEPCQRIEPHLSVDLREVSLTPHDDAEALEEAEVRRPFDLSAGPLLRACLWHRPDGHGKLQLCLHHAVADGWSVKIILTELQALLSGQPLPPLTHQYADFAAWQRQMVDSGALAPQTDYWRRQLGGNVDGLVLEGDRPRPPSLTQRGLRLIRPLPIATARRVRRLALQCDATPFVTLLAAYKALLAWYAQVDDIVVGTVVANRNHAKFQSLVGFVVNMLTLRTNLGGDPRFVDIVQRVRHVVLDAHANQDLPFETLVDLLQPPRDPGRTPLFQIAFDMRDPAITRATLPGVELGVMEADLGSCQYDLHLTFEERGEGLVAIWMANADLFEAATIERMVANYEALVEAAVEAPDTRLSAMPLPAAAERRLLDQWNQTARPYPRDRGVHQLFAEQAARKPGAIAVEHGTRRLSYSELDRQANRLARHLRGLGVGPEVPVGLSMERSPALIVALLAILKAGGAYVPLDPEYPPERLRLMVGDAATQVIVTESSIASRLPQGTARLVIVDRDLAQIEAQAPTPPESPGLPEGLAYVIYTSGSTGVPKGVQVIHRSISRLVLNTDYVRFLPDDRVAQVSVVSFDAATFEIWGALLHGACLVIVDRETTLDPAALARFLREQRITVMFLTAALFDRVAREQPSAFGHMRWMLYGGAAASADALRAVLDSAAPPLHLVNGYGPTEVTTFAVTHEVKAVEPGAASVPIGRPIANTTAHVLGRFGERVPIGVAGELVLGGDGVARGYLRRPELSAERFIPDPFAGRAGATMYRTGDLVRRRSDGLIDFLGRNDQQIKLRGFRIELGEIEATMCTVPGVGEAVVVVRRAADGDATLAAYYTSRDDAMAPGPEQLRQQLRELLPGYMVPGSIVRLRALPLSPNGKVDRSALPDSAASPADADPTVQPQGEIERIIAEVWSVVLGHASIDRHQNFFDAGGHSLKVARVQGMLSERLDREFTIVDLFRYPTIATLAAHLGAATPRE